MIKMAMSEAQLRAKAKYNKKTYEQIKFTVRYDAEINGDYIRAHAAEQGESMNVFLKRAVAEAIARDKQKS